MGRNMDLTADLDDLLQFFLPGILKKATFPQRRDNVLTAHHSPL
jgi:hypothetical protein